MDNTQKGRAWAVVRKIKGGEVVHKVETTPDRIDRVIGGMPINANTEDYYIDEWYEFPRKGQKDRDGKTKDMTVDDYKSLMDLKRKAEAALKEYAEAEKPWIDAAWKLVVEKAMPVRGVFLFDDRVEYTCVGTGIYSTESWNQSFPISELFERLGILPKADKA